MIDKIRNCTGIEELFSLPAKSETPLQGGWGALLLEAACLTEVGSESTLWSETNPFSNVDLTTSPIFWIIDLELFPMSELVSDEHDETRRRLLTAGTTTEIIIGIDGVEFQQVSNFTWGTFTLHQLEGFIEVVIADPWDREALPSSLSEALLSAVRELSGYSSLPVYISVLRPPRDVDIKYRIVAADTLACANWITKETTLDISNIDFEQGLLFLEAAANTKDHNPEPFRCTHDTSMVRHCVFLRGGGVGGERER